VKIEEQEGRLGNFLQCNTAVFVQPASADCSRSLGGMPKRNRKLMKVTHV